VSQASKENLLKDINGSLRSTGAKVKNIIKMSKAYKREKRKLTAKHNRFGLTRNQFRKAKRSNKGMW